LVTAGVLSWWRTHHNQRVRELEIVNRFSEDVPSKGIFCSEEYKGPQILAKVFGTGLLSDFNSYTENLSYSSGDEKEAEECALFLKEFYNLEKITFEHFTYDNGNAFPSDKTLSQISTLKNLRSLEIASARITDSGMKSISHCTKLTNLNLYETPVSSRGVRYLDSTPFLEWLILRKTKIDDTAAETLGRLDNLFYLDVSGTKLTDKSVPYLGRLSHLEHLIISDTDISEKGYRELESMLPNCDIAYK
jgi:Leucine-rich repeat (LRR) protein